MAMMAEQFVSLVVHLVRYVLFSNFAASEYAPDFTIISAGFDAARGDPLGCCDVNILAH